MIIRVLNACSTTKINEIIAEAHQGALTSETIIINVSDVKNGSEFAPDINIDLTICDFHVVVKYCKNYDIDRKLKKCFNELLTRLVESDCV
jgi:hypothetical protein